MERDRLLEDHRRADAIIRRLDAFLDRHVAPVEPAFAQLRWMLLREFTRHHAMETAALQRTGGRGAAHDQGLAEAFRAHMIQWSATAIQDRWPHYRHAARLLLDRMRRQMRHEEMALFPMLRGC